AVIAPIPDGSTGVALGELIVVTGSPLPDEMGEAIEHVARRMGDLLETVRPRSAQPSWETLVDFAGAFEHAPYAIVCTDQAGQLLMANAACEQMTGYSRMELLKMHTDDLIADRFHEGIRSLRRRFQHAAGHRAARSAPTGWWVAAATATSSRST
nr:PAS domain S-box protein [Thermoleophilaceae bacterium]